MTTPVKKPSCGPVNGWCRVVPGCQRCTAASVVPDVWKNFGLSGPLVPNYTHVRESASARPASQPAGTPAEYHLPLVSVCDYEGTVTQFCKSCGKKEGRHVRDCGHPDNPTESCTRDYVAGRTWSCAGCLHHTGRSVLPASPLPPLSVVDIPTDDLAKGTSGWAFNGGAIRYKGNLVLAYRTDWQGARCHVVELDENYVPIAGTNKHLRISHPVAPVGEEDPQLFVYRGRLHVAYVGVARGKVKELRTAVLYARLNDDYTTDRVFLPQCAARTQPMEKNWGFFEYRDELYCVYTARPHVVLKIDGEKAAKVYETPYPFAWGGGHLRGGASPVRVGDRFYNWVHGRVDNGGVLVYSTGLYTFAAEPPFRPLAATPTPLLWSDTADNAARDKNYCSCWFPRGAVLDAANNRWEITAGRNDRGLSRATWDAGGIDKLLGGPLVGAKPDWFEFRDGTGDCDIWKEVVTDDTYALGNNPVPPGTGVLDAGAHIGSAAYMTHKAGAAVIHCYEAAPENAAVLARHAGHIPGVTVFHAPLVGDNSTPTYLKVPEQEKNRGGYWVVTDPALGEPTTPAVGVIEAVRKCAAASPAGRVGLFKMDCEGSEWGQLQALAANPDVLALVDRLAGEHHPLGPALGIAGIKAMLEPHGFVVTEKPGDDGRGVFYANRRLAPPA